MARSRDDLFIFKKMSPEDGRELLLKSGKSWLIRESNTFGMLTIDHASEGSLRFALTSKGWKLVKGETGYGFTENYKYLTAKNAQGYINQLLKLICSICNLSISSRLNPLKAQQTQTDLFQTYVLHVDAVDTSYTQMMATVVTPDFKTCDSKSSAFETEERNQYTYSIAQNRSNLWFNYDKTRRAKLQDFPADYHEMGVIFGLRPVKTLKG